MSDAIAMNAGAGGRPPAEPGANGVVLQTQAVTRHFDEGGRTLEVLKGVDLEIHSGEWVCIFGRSGSGKSTLLHLLGGLDRPTSGQVRFRGEPLAFGAAQSLNRYRRKEVGLVFQSYHLLPELSALENVLIAGMLRFSVAAWQGARAEMRRRGVALLEQMGLGDRLGHKPNQLSGGERQRVAIARSLINQPAVLLADEPTGNLDLETSASIMEVFTELHAGGQTIVMVTHDRSIAEFADRSVELRRGLVHEE